MELTAWQKQMMELEAAKEQLWETTSGISMKRIDGQGAALQRAPQRIGAKGRKLQDTKSRGFRRRTAAAERRGELAA